MSAPETTTTTALMPMVIGEHRIAVEALSVLEILGPQQWVAIPNTPPMLPGALAWRGRAVGVLDLGPALDLPTLSAPSTRNRNAILQLTDDTVALSVDRVLEVCRAAADAIAPVHAASWVVDGGLPCRGEIELDELVVPILDLDAWAVASRRAR
ncbi:CheW-like domain protein [Enhygromyxa salina]|uniref:CheW-like domain protein n=1 Tax=Enhygromyxa salina TaxID=215803 RepID=A0A2S9YG83_9BACT|nr:chemotaxis protein CheW [Enhygromyxa salina]PRQ04117.1 CheW-like domain protein [Enhygromyxa salina]